MEVFDKEFLLKAAKNQLNVLFIGRKGVGKTHVTRQILEQAGYKVMYLSVANIDPYLSFVGIPEKIDNDYFNMLLPKWFSEGYNAILLDELGRSRPAINNALLELIQFGTMHGKDLGIKLIWAATNPTDDLDEKYDVEVFDPALEDRFDIKIRVPYEVDDLYFREKYQKMGDIAVEFWRKELTGVQRVGLSPRRLDRAIECFKMGFDLQHILPNEGEQAINSSALMARLNDAYTIEQRLATFFTNNDTKGAKEFLSPDNNFSSSLSHIQANKEYIDFFIPLLHKERTGQLCIDNLDIAKHVLQNPNTYDESLAKTIERKGGDFLVLYNTKNTDTLIESEPIDFFYNFTMAEFDGLNIQKINYQDYLDLYNNEPSEIGKVEIIAGMVINSIDKHDDNDWLISTYNNFATALAKINLEKIDKNQCAVAVVTNMFYRLSLKKRNLLDKVISFDSLSDNTVEADYGETLAAFNTFCIGKTWEKIKEIRDAIRQKK